MSLPDIFSIMLRSTFLARSTMRATSGASSSTFRSTGRASSSPSWARSIRALSFPLSSISSEVPSPFCLVALLAFFGFTPQPPFPSVVLVIPGGEHGRPDQKVRSFRQLLNRPLQGVETLLLFLPEGRLLFTPSPFMLVFESGDLPHYSAAYVFPDYPPV